MNNNSKIIIKSGISAFLYASIMAGVFYYHTNILGADPFKTLDYEGVGKLVTTSVKLGRSTRKDLHVGVCGETGGDARSILFYHQAGLDYVSCSPFRVPVARLAAAQANIKYPRNK